MSVLATAPQTASARLVTVFERLFEGEFITLERFAISSRTPDGMRCLDETTALAGLLAQGDPDAPFEPADPWLGTVHRAMDAAWPDVAAVVSGPSRTTRTWSSVPG